MISLLYLTARSAEAKPLCLPASLADIALDNFPIAVQNILCAGATAQEIPARQAIFRLLEDDGNAENFRVFGEILANIGRLVKRFQNTENETGKALLFAEICRLSVSLKAVSDSLEGCAEGGNLLGAVLTELHRGTEALWFLDMVQTVGHMADSALRLSFRFPALPVGVTLCEDGSFSEKWQKNALALGAETFPEKRFGKRSLPASFPDCLAKLRPEETQKARNLREKYEENLFGTFNIGEFVPLADEIDFYFHMRTYTRKAREAGYPMTLPTLTQTREIRLRDLYDCTLLQKGIDGADVVPNDVTMTAEGKESFFLLTGANGGGKTTYLRAVAVACVLFLNGCPAPCRAGEMAYFDRLFTHFPNDEDYKDAGRYADEVRRAEEITAAAGATTLAFLNETFSGTDETKSANASRNLAGALYASGTFGIYVTHLHELTGGEIPTLAAVIDETDDNRRTYKIVREHRTNSSHARDILYRYGLTKEQLEKRRENRKEDT